MTMSMRKKRRTPPKARRKAVVAPMRGRVTTAGGRVDGDDAVPRPAEPPSAPARQPTAGQSASSRAAFFRVPRDRTPFFIAFLAKLSPGLATDGATSFVPGTVKGRTSDRLKRSVKDGDTIGVAFNGSQSIRFLGIDTPEKSFSAPFRLGVNGKPIFVDIGTHTAEWDTYLINAVTPGGAHTVVLRAELQQRLAQRITPGVAANHATLAAAASKALFDHVSQDITDLANGDLDQFGIFGAMSHEPFDGFGRILAFLRPDQPDTKPENRRVEYNTRQLADGVALPYFIWPNVDPFRRATLITESVFPPAVMRKRAREAPALDRARKAVRAARQARRPGSLFDPQQPLRLAAFELRFLADKRPPHRLVIDLAAPDPEPILWPGDAYFVVPNPEDRLYLPPEYVPLFKQPQNGWREPTPQELAAKIAGAPNVGPTGLP